MGVSSHVMQSSLKLLSLTADPLKDREAALERGSPTGSPGKKRHWFGTTVASNPILRFAFAFAALIHDVDHHGVPNSQLVEEKTETALFYKNLSVAEQNSLDVVWEMFMESQYAALRGCIYKTREEFQMFRQTVVNCVISTDIFDEKLSNKRAQKWDMAFNGKHSEMTVEDLCSLRGTVVLEYLMQAANVAHTMQNWNLYLVRFIPSFFLFVIMIIFCFR